MTRVTMLSGLSALSLIAASQAHAQQADDTGKPNSVSLEEVIVTATRAETNLQQTPIAVTGISSESIRQRSITNLVDVSAFVPGLSIGAGQGLGTGTANVAIRGMGVDSGDSEASVGTYVDEVFFSSGRGNILGLMDTARVEVLRGPQGTLFGRNTIAGAIQYVTNGPKKDFGGYVTGTYGAYDRTDLETAINLPVSDTFALRVAARYADRDGYVYDQTRKTDRGAETTKAVRVRALWTPTDQLTVNLKAEHIDFKNNGRAALATAVNPNAFFTLVGGFSARLTNFYISPDFHPGDYTARGFDAPDFFKFRQDILQSTVEYEINDHAKLKSITSRSWFKHQLGSDIDQTPLPILSILDTNFRTKAFTQEFQLTGDLLSGGLRYTAGVYYYNRTNRQEPSRLQTSAAFGSMYTDGDPATKNEAIAGYGQLSYDLSPVITANVGLRYSRETATAQLLAVPGSRENKNSFSDVSPQFGLDFKPTEDVFLYVKAAKGFRAGGFTLNPAIPGGSIPFAPEKAWTYEAGLRLTALDGRLRFNPTVYQTDWKDIQFLDNALVGNPPNFIVLTRNAGDARIRGVELESQFAVTSDLSLRGSFAYIDGKYTRVANNVLTGRPIVPLTEPLARAPKYKYALGASYTVPLKLDGKLTANVDYSWVDDQKSTVRRTNTVIMPSTGLLSARLQYAAPGDRFSVAIFGSNLTNEYYLLGGTRFGAEGTVAADTVDVGRPREIGAEVRFNF